MRRPRFISASSRAVTLTAEAAIELTAAAGEGKPTKLRVLAYTGTIITIGSTETLIDVAGVSLPARINLLADHANALSAVVGHVTPRVEGARLLADGEAIEATAAGREFIALARSGAPIGASVGLEVVAQKFIKEGETVRANGTTHTAGPRGLRFVSRSRLREITATPIGADPDADIHIAAKRHGGPMSIFSRKLSTQQTDNTHGAEHDDPAALEAAWLAEVESITGDDPQYASIKASAIAEGWTIERVKAATLASLRASRPASPGIVRVNASQLPAADTRKILAAAALMHSGHTATAEKQLGEQAVTAAASLRVTSWVDLCRAALRMAHVDEPMNRDEMIRAAFSTTSLPIALGDSANKTVIEAFNNTPATWRTVAHRRTVSTFKEHNALRPWNTNMALSELPNGGQIEHGVIGEQNFTHSTKTYGKMLGVTRTDIINDTAGIFADLAAEFGRQALRTMGDTFWTAVLGNADSHWSGENGNYLSGGSSPLSITSLGLAIKALRNMTDGDSRPIDLQPFALVVPPTLEATARGVLNSAQLMRDQQDDMQTTANPWNGAARLEVEPRLESSAFAGSSTTAWYLWANPMQAPAVIVSFLNGVENPVVEVSASDFNTLGMQMRCYIDFGADLADTRGAIKSAGA